MRMDVKVSDAKNKKQKIEKQIAEIINSFHKDYKVNIVNININCISKCLNGNNTYDVELEVSL